MDYPQHVPLLQCLASGRIRMPACRATLRNVILRGAHCDAGTCTMPAKALLSHRHPCNTSPQPHCYEPVIIVVVQGIKSVSAAGQSVG